ncbi:hypothetical protein [Paraburkholderia sp. J63]|uniref:hypothetical protein n=1 Tax=Paraburkholderia sp. J63 TaxID=2805434 RepID=UPI002ABE874A|nr:hypothetical protein [Paraburkholderia sp. J63]
MATYTVGDFLENQFPFIRTVSGGTLSIPNQLPQEGTQSTQLQQGGSWISPTEIPSLPLDRQRETASYQLTLANAPILNPDLYPDLGVFTLIVNGAIHQNWNKVAVSSYPIYMRDTAEALPGGESIVGAPFSVDPPPSAHAMSYDKLLASQQRDAILASMDFRAAIEDLLQDEGLTPYDLTHILDVSRGNIQIWRTKPLEKLREANRSRMSALLYTWKYWVQQENAPPLGRWLRTPIWESLTLLDVLASGRATDRDCAIAVDLLKPIWRKITGLTLERRRNLAGLPRLEI